MNITVNKPSKFIVPTAQKNIAVEFCNIRHDVRTLFDLDIDGEKLHNIILTKGGNLKKTDARTIQEKFGARMVEDIQMFIPVFVMA